MMNYEVKSYSFFRTPNGGADYVNDGKLFHLSAEMLNCLLNQYKVMGFKVIFNNDSFVSVAKVTNEIEVFSARMDEMARNLREARAENK